VVLSPGCHGAGHSLRELQIKAEVESIRRGDALLSAVSMDTQLQDNDIVILRGSVSLVERAEAILLAG
jgi:CPA2 family monovalent cation:H+ antiporter-2